MNTDSKKKPVVSDLRVDGANAEVDDGQAKKLGPGGSGKAGRNPADSNSKLDVDDSNHAGSQKRAFKPATKTGLNEEGRSPSQRTDGRERLSQKGAREASQARTNV